MEKRSFSHPLATAINAYVMQDEARHVAFGRLALRDYYPHLTEKERAEREEFVVEACYLMRDRFRVRRQLKVLTAQGRMSGWMLGGLPVVLGVALYFMNPSAFETFVTDPTGLWLFKLAITLEIVGVVAIHNILKVEY